MALIVVPEDVENEKEKRGLDMVVTILYIQGMWYDEDTDPDLEGYLKYFSHRTALLIVRHRILHHTLQFYRRFSPWNLMIYSFLQAFIIQPVDLYLSRDVKFNVLVDLYVILLVGLIIISVACVLCQKKQCRDIVEELQMISKEFRREDEEIQKMFRGSQRLCHLFVASLKFVGIFFAVFSAFQTVAFLLPRRLHSIRGWYPFDQYASPAFEITLLVEAAYISLLFLQGNTLTALTITVFLTLNVHFKILCYKLRNIKKGAMRKVQASKENVRMVAASGEARLVNLLDVSGSDNMRGGRAAAIVEEGNPLSGENQSEVYNSHFANTFYVSGSDNMRRGRAAAIVEEGNPWTGENESEIYNSQPQVLRFNTSIHHRSNSETTAQRGDIESGRITEDDNIEEDEEEEELDNESLINHKELDQEMNRQLRDAVKIHQKLLRLTHGWGSFWEYHYIYLYNLSIFLLALTVIQLTSVESMGIKEFLLSVLSLQMFELYFVSNFLPNLITTQAAAVSEALYACDWLEASPTFKRSMLIIMCRTNQLLLIKPTGLDELSIKTFGEVANIAYKMLASIRTMLAK